jgi:hypothetical protein
MDAFSPGLGEFFVKQRISTEVIQILKFPGWNRKASFYYRA